MTIQLPSLLLLLATLTLLFFNDVHEFTTFVVGKKASIDGSVLATHSNDGGGTTDPRLVKITAADYPAGSARPIWVSPENYPRYIGSARVRLLATAKIAKLEPRTVPTSNLLDIFYK